MHPISIRSFTPQHQDVAKDLILAGLVDHWGFLDPALNPDLDDIAAYYRDAVFLLAWRGDVLVGTGALVPESEGTGRIVRMSVVKSERRQGIGSIILAALLAAGRDRGCTRIVLETTSTWEDVIRFYVRNDFRIVGEYDGDTHFEHDLG